MTTDLDDPRADDRAEARRDDPDRDLLTDDNLEHLVDGIFRDRTERRADDLR